MSDHGICYDCKKKYYCKHYCHNLKDCDDYEYNIDLYEDGDSMDIREKLKKANGVEIDKKPNDKERIAQLEAENSDLMDAVIELADIIAGGE